MTVIDDIAGILNPDTTKRSGLTVPTPRLTQALVTAVGTGGSTGTLSLQLNRSSNTKTGVKYLSSYSPVANDIVWVLQNGSDVLVLGTLAGATDARNLKAWAYRAAALTLTANPANPIIIPFDTEITDPNSNFSTSTSRYTCAIAGSYAVSGRISAQATAAGQRLESYIYLNASELVRGIDITSRGADIVASIVTASFIDCATGDIIDIRYYSTAALVAEVNSGTLTHVRIKYLGP